MVLLNPKTEKFAHLDGQSREIMHKTIEFFEKKGKIALLEDDKNRVWYRDFLDFLKDNQVFATLLTPPEYGGGATSWNNFRNCDFNEILGFYGLAYWYAWQVSILGLGPIWMSPNEEVKKKTGRLLRDGGIFAFGLSEKNHGADLYSSDMMITPLGDGKYVADGGKYYIGIGNEAALVSTFAKDSETDEYVFFAVESSHPNYECVKNVVSSQMFVSEYALHAYPLTEADILTRGEAAWDSALNTVNVGKYNLGWASIGMCTHSLYEALNHAAHRNLYGKFVTDFPHCRSFFVDAYARLAAMKLFALRASDYLRAASLEDRRYLLYNPLVKMKVTSQGEEVMNLLWDVIAAKGFEKDVYFESAARGIRALPKLEGTVHVNMALVNKFIANYFFNPAEFKDPPRMDQPGHDAFLFNQGPTKGLGKIRFHDYNLAYDSLDLPNIRVFKSQVAVYKEMLAAAPPDKAQAQDIDFLFVMGELFTLVAYGQLIIENAHILSVDNDLVDRIFDFMVRDFSKFALQLYSKPSCSPAQMELCLKMIKKPAADQAGYDRVWNDQVFSLVDKYEMNK
ncbi:MAG: acyl-CoA dehydrogenase family protein [Pseudomonadota bacterium]